MIILWISLVPSKMAEILDYGAVSAGQHPVDLRGISTGCPKGMTALGRPPHVAERSPDMLGGQRESSGSSSSWAKCTNKVMLAGAAVPGAVVTWADSCCIQRAS